MDLNTIITSVVTLSVGLFVFLIYKIEKTDKDRSAANIVLEEIRTIETNIDKLKESGDLLSVVPANLSTTGWFTHRHSLVRYMDFDEISKIGLFFERIEALKEMLDQWRLIYFESMKAKATKMQETIIEIARDKKDKANYEKEIKGITDIVHDENYWFEPKIYKNQINSKLGLLSPISTTTTGEKLKKIGEKKWYSRGI